MAKIISLRNSKTKIDFQFLKIQENWLLGWPHRNVYQSHEIKQRKNGALGKFLNGKCLLSTVRIFILSKATRSCSCTRTYLHCSIRRWARSLRPSTRWRTTRTGPNSHSWTPRERHTLYYEIEDNLKELNHLYESITNLMEPTMSTILFFLMFVCLCKLYFIFRLMNIVYWNSLKNLWSN